VLNEFIKLTKLIKETLVLHTHMKSSGNEMIPGDKIEGVPELLREGTK
jgi:hypothetical protein